MALRRPQQDPAPREQPGGVISPERKPPRWAVVATLIFYCSACWVLVWAVGAFGVDLVRTAIAAAR